MCLYLEQDTSLFVSSHVQHTIICSQRDRRKERELWDRWIAIRQGVMSICVPKHAHNSCFDILPHIIKKIIIKYIRLSLRCGLSTKSFIKIYFFHYEILYRTFIYFYMMLFVTSSFLIFSKCVCVCLSSCLLVFYIEM